MTLVVDATVVVAACLAAGDGFAFFSDEALLAPDLMWWEAGSTLHEYLWRLEARRPTPDMPTLQRGDVLTGLDRLRRAPVERAAATEDLLDEAWRVANRCGFARLYDAAYVALAIQRGARLVTLDGRLRTGPASRLAAIVGPTELGPGSP